MKGKKHTPQQIIRKLRDAEADLAAGLSISEIARKLQISEATYYRWRRQYGGMKADEVKRLKELEQENRRLKRLIGELELDKAILKEALEGKGLSPARKRAAVGRAQQRLGVSERRACKVVGQPRSTQRYRPRRAKDEVRLVRRMTELARQNPRYGYRRIWALLRREGWEVNKKRIYRLWRREGLKVPQKQHKKRRLGSSENACVRRRPERKDHVWAWDFIHDRTAGGRPLNWLTIVDEFTRECLALKVERSIKAEDVKDQLIRLFTVRGVPDHIRSDNGPEFIARAIRRWLERAEVKTLYVGPGAPWENGYAEAFQSRLRDELLNAEEFRDVREAAALAQQWRRHYNRQRPHSALGYLTPAEFAAARVPPGLGSFALPEHARAEQQYSLIASGT
ncbi:MAG: IS3 family transposase [Candidatus Brocadiia bacterium]